MTQIVGFKLLWLVNFIKHIPVTSASFLQRYIYILLQVLAWQMFEQDLFVFPQDLQIENASLQLLLERYVT